MQIVNLKFPENGQSGAMCRFCSAKLSHLLCRLCYVVEGFREGILN